MILRFTVTFVFSIHESYTRLRAREPPNLMKNHDLLYKDTVMMKNVVF
jgi:hypothetical protein